MSYSGRVRQAARGPALPALPAAVRVRSACRTSERGGLTLSNGHVRDVRAVADPVASAVKSSQTSLRGLAKRESTEGGDATAFGSSSF